MLKERGDGHDFMVERSEVKSHGWNAVSVRGGFN